MGDPVSDFWLGIAAGLCVGWLLSNAAHAWLDRRERAWAAERRAEPTLLQPDFEATRPPEQGGHAPRG